MDKSKEIYAVWGRGLGDCWSSMNVYMTYGINRNEIIRVATWYPKGPKIRDVSTKLYEMIDLFNFGNLIELTDERPTHRLGSKEPSQIEYLPTKRRWDPDSRGTICYQFDGKSHREKNFPSAQEEQMLLDHLTQKGHSVVRLGWPMSLKDIVDKMAMSQFFVGVESGMLHIAHSVGLPRYVILNGFLEETVRGLHGNKDYKMFANAKEFIEHGPT